MIGVITASKTSGSVLGYDFGDKKDKDQKIHFLASEGVILDARQVDRLNQNWTDAASLKEFKFISRSVADDLSKQFDSQASVNDRIVRTTGHIALSFSPLDRKRLQDDEFKIQVATEYMEEMGITDTQWVLVEHEETNAPHLHIAYNRVKYDGTVVDSKNERYRSQKIAAELSEKYGLTLAGETPRMEKSLTPEQQQFEQMRLLAREALQESCTMEEFKSNLRKRGIELRLSEHSEQQKSYGISYAMGEISAKGSKLDRSALSYAKVTATLEKNLATRTAMEQKAAQDAAHEKVQELRAAYKEMVPTIQKLHASVTNAFQLYTDAKQAGVSINTQTDQRYGELKQTWKEFRSLNADRSKAQTAKDVVKAIGGMMLLLNPIAGLLVLAVGSIAHNIRISNINTDKKALLSKIEGLKTDIDALKQQKAQINIEKKERLDEYLHAKDAKNEFQVGMDGIKAEIDKIKEQTKPNIAFDFKAARKRDAATTETKPAKSTTVARPSITTVDISSVILSAKDKDSLDLALLDKRIVIEPIKDRFGGVADFKVTLAAEGRVVNASNLIPGDRMRQWLDKWENLTGEPLAYKMEIQRGNQRKLADICAKMDAASPENAPRIPRTISFLPGGEIKVSYYNSGRREEQDIMVDANGKMKFNGLELDINTGKYTQLPGQRQTPHHSQGESKGEEKGYGGRGI